MQARQGFSDFGVTYIIPKDIELYKFCAEWRGYQTVWDVQINQKVTWKFPGSH